jgi:hypothetical protein
MNTCAPFSFTPSRITDPSGSRTYNRSRFQTTNTAAATTSNKINFLKSTSHHQQSKLRTEN